MSRNFGIGHRDMAKAGCMALGRAQERKEISFGTQAKYEQSWSQFAGWAKDGGIKRMEHITAGTVMGYGRELAAQVEAGHMAASTAQNLVTAVNKVMRLASQHWKPVSATKQCGIEERSRVREGTPATLDRNEYQARLQAASHTVSDRALAVCMLARELGLRSKEASLLDAKKALQEALSKRPISVVEGTKGGRHREVAATSQTQLEALSRAAAAQDKARAVMPPDKNWKTWREGELRTAREAMGGLHELRAAYACERYETITGHGAPCTGAAIGSKVCDYLAREEIALELGHGRIDVLAEYVGGRK